MPYFEVQLTQKLQRIYDVGPDTLIGRAPQCHIQILSRAVSRRHARMEFDGAQAIVSDLGTKNGIKLNGSRVDGAAVVGDGDVLLVGDISMTYRAASRAVGGADAIDLRRRLPVPDDVRAAFRPRQTFILPAHPDALVHFQTSVARERIGGLLDFDELSRFKLQLALKEALENAFHHGCGRDPRRAFQVTFGEDQDEFVMSVRDEGPGYDVEAVLEGAEEVEPIAAVRDRAQLGKPLGLRIILGCVDRLQFEGRGSTIHMGRIKSAGELLEISEDTAYGAQGGTPAFYGEEDATGELSTHDDLDPFPG